MQKSIKNQLHAASRIQQSRQKEPSVKTFRFSLSEGIAYFVAELNAALSLYTRAKKWKPQPTNPQPFGFTVTLCAAVPRLA